MCSCPARVIIRVTSHIIPGPHCNLTTSQGILAGILVDTTNQVTVRYITSQKLPSSSLGARDGHFLSGHKTSFLMAHLTPCSYWARTAPEDVARVEKQTYVCTERKEDAVPEPRPGVESTLGNWKSPTEMDTELNKKFPGCMQGTAVCVVG